MLEEIINEAYDCPKRYKDYMKMMLDKVITQKRFSVRTESLYNSHLHLFLKKLKFHWTDFYIVHKVHPHGEVEVHNTKDGITFQVNSHHLKPYREYLSSEVEEFFLEDPVYQD